MPANDALVISGKLTAKTYTVTWKVNGEIVGTTTVTFGEAIADYEYTAPAGYTFGAGNESHVRLCFAIAPRRLEEALRRITGLLDRPT